MSKLHVMLDLETWSTKTNATIISIGAVKFDPLNPNVEMEKFHVGIDPALLSSALRDGFDIDPNTLKWWMDHERDVARIDWVSLIKCDLGTALEGFAMWYGDDPKVPVWGNGAAFDNVLLAESYRLVGMPKPWGFRSDRCYRTLRAVVPSVVAAPADVLDGPAHNALSDAIYQARHLQQLYAALAMGPAGVEQ